MTALTARAIAAARRASALYCATYGSGTPLLLIHCLGRDACGAEMAPIIPALAARYQTIVPDLRGHGQSRRLPAVGGAARMAADLDDLVDLLGLPPCFVVANGDGAAVARAFARDYPARVRGLALIEAAEGAGDKKQGGLLARISARVRGPGAQSKEGALPTLRITPSGGLAGALDMLVPWLERQEAAA